VRCCHWGSSNDALRHPPEKTLSDLDEFHLRGACGLQLLSREVEILYEAEYQNIGLFRKEKDKKDGNRRRRRELSIKE
jgi:hypothetical protein